MLGLKVKIGTKTVDIRSQSELHSVKSFAGTVFHEDGVKSVCVFDETGKVNLYLNKTPNGVYREENR